jgi:hypothetical protein
MQRALDKVFLYLQEEYPQYEYIWNVENMKKWGKYPAREKQIESIKRFMKDFDTENLNKMQATQILNRLFYR